MASRFAICYGAMLSPALEPLIAFVPGAGFNLWPLTPRPGDSSLEDAIAARSARRVALLAGAEGDGLTLEPQAAADRRNRLPMADRTDSIDVAVATGIEPYRLASARHG